MSIHDVHIHKEPRCRVDESDPLYEDCPDCLAREATIAALRGGKFSERDYTAMKARAERAEAAAAGAHGHARLLAECCEDSLERSPHINGYERMSRAVLAFREDAPAPPCPDCKRAQGVVEAARAVAASTSAAWNRRSE